MDNDQRRQKYEIRKSYNRHWKTTLLKAPATDCGFCCYALCCGPCASYSLRARSLYNDMSRYVCCNGDCPCSGKMQESQSPECCLCLEVTCCFAQSVASTRWLLQDEMHLENTACDNCLIGTMIMLQYLALVCQIVACITGSEDMQLLASLIDCLADAFWCSVCACMQTQHHVQLQERAANPSVVMGPAMAASLPTMAPGRQQVVPYGATPGQPGSPGYVTGVQVNVAPGTAPQPVGMYGQPPPGYSTSYPPAPVQMHSTPPMQQPYPTMVAYNPPPPMQPTGMYR